MGSPLADDIQWVCDGCGKDIPQGKEIRPDPNRYNSYCKDCHVSKGDKGKK